MGFEEDMFKMMMDNNLNCVVRFHNHLNVSLNQVRKEIATWDEIDNSKKSYWAHVYEKEFPKQLRQTTFLLMFGHLEEMLHLLWKKDKKSQIELDNRNGISKYKPFIRHHLGGDLDSSEEYRFIVNAQEVRNSFLHVAGRISMMRDPKRVESIIKSSKGMYSNKSDRIKVSVEASLKLQHSIAALLESIYKSIASV